MGSPLRLVASGDRIDEAWRLVLQRVREVARDLTRFDPHSALSRLNRQAGSGSWVDVPTSLRRALLAAARGHRATDGRFDPRVVGALEALGDRAGVPLPPSPATLRRGDAWLELDRSGRRARLADPVDLGGMGKGFAVAEASAALDAIGVECFLLESGGDLAVRGQAPDGDGWAVAVEHPERDLPLAVVRLPGGAMATSSTRVRRWNGPEGSGRHHLVDPETGQPVRGAQSVTVHAADPVEAEIRATAAFIGLGRGASPSPDMAAWWVSTDGQGDLTPAAERMTVRLSPRATSASASWLPREDSNLR